MNSNPATVGLLGLGMIRTGLDWDCLYFGKFLFFPPKEKEEKKRFPPFKVTERYFQYENAKLGDFFTKKNKR